jgi:ribonuclease P protein component
MSNFPKSNRLLTSNDFKKAFDQGLKIVSRDIVVVIRPRESEGSADNGPRLGLVITKKIGNAVVRNKFKRNMREVFRQAKAQLSEQGWNQNDFVVIARAKSPAISQQQLATSFFWCLNKAKQVAKRVAIATSDAPATRSVG